MQPMLYDSGLMIGLNHQLDDTVGNMDAYHMLKFRLYLFRGLDHLG
jgi:hypothetical protein